MLRALNIDAIAQVDTAIKIAKSFPGQQLTFGFVMDPDMRAADYLPAVLKLKKHAAVFARPFDSSSYVVDGKPRYDIRSYRARAKDYAEVISPHCWATEFGNEIGVDNDPDWIPSNIWKCVAAALEVAHQYRVKSVVTGFLEPDEPRHMLDAFLAHPEVKPDVLGVSFYPYTGSSRASKASTWVYILGDVIERLRQTNRDAIVTEYGSQRADGKLGTPAQERELIRAFEAAGHSCAWNALKRWKDVKGVYSEVWK